MIEFACWHDDRISAGLRQSSDIGQDVSPRHAGQAEQDRLPAAPNA